MHTEYTVRPGMKKRRIIVTWLSSCGRFERDLLWEVQHLPTVMFHKPYQATDCWEGTLLDEYPLLARRHILQECVKCGQISVHNSIGKRERKDTVWRCPEYKGATMHSRVLQIVPQRAKVFVNVGNVFFAKIFSVNFHFFSIK